MTKFRGVSKQEILEIGQDMAIHNFCLFLDRQSYTVHDDEGDIIHNSILADEFEQWMKAYK